MITAAREARRASHWETSQYMEGWTKLGCGPQLGLLPKVEVSWGGEGIRSEAQSILETSKLK